MARDRFFWPGPAEPLAKYTEPTQFAELEISVAPDQRARGRVPFDHARYLITTLGILGSAATGTGGAILVLYVAPRLTIVVIAELALALVAAVLIVGCGRIPVTEKNNGAKNHEGLERPSGCVLHDRLSPASCPFRRKALQKVAHRDVIGSAWARRGQSNARTFDGLG